MNEVATIPAHARPLKRSSRAGPLIRAGLFPAALAAAFVAGRLSLPAPVEVPVAMPVAKPVAAPPLPIAQAVEPAPAIDVPAPPFASAPPSVPIPTAPVPWTELRGTLRGRVLGLIHRRGLLALAVGRERIYVRGRPEELSGLVPGAVASLEYGRYGSMNWVKPVPGLLPRHYAEHGTLTGTVRAIDPGRGLVKVQDRLFHVRPELVAGVIPGERVALEYDLIDGERWVRTLVPPLE